MIRYAQLGLRGRLGNAAYELAAACGVAAMYREGVRFNENWIHRPYFCVPDAFFGPTDDLDDAWLRKALDHIDDRSKPYMQDWNLFADIMSTIRAYLSPSNLALETLNGPRCAEFYALPRPVLSVHVRRGDNVEGQDPGTPDKWRWQPCPPESYYREAIAVHAPRAASIAVFSDEPEWCADHLGDLADYVHYGVPRPKEHEPDYLTSEVSDQWDFFMQVDADLHVCSNSTFGIMAALLADDEHPPIVPWPIFGPLLSYIDASLLFPSTWQRLSF